MQQTEGGLMAKRGTRVPVPTAGQASPAESQADTLQAIFGRNFREKRLAAGLTQKAAAEAAGMHRQEITTIENGIGNVTLKTMQRLADVVSCEVEVLLKQKKRV